ncbi:MAG: hypothetical protein AAGG01_13455 [Planctomycetota bacterium]
MLSLALPIAALIAARLAVRGKPWHGALVVTLGVLLFLPLWALITGGVAGFTHRVQDPIWSRMTAAFALLGLVTGVPAIRAKLFGSLSWRRAKARAQASRSRRTASGDTGFALWQHELQENVTALHPSDWERAITSIVPASPPTPEALYADSSALESRYSGPFSQASRALHEVLEGGLDPSGWRALLELRRGLGPALGAVERGALIAQAASREEALGHAVGFLFCSGVETLVEALGTPEQREQLLPLLGPNNRSCADILAGSWSSLGPQGVATGTVVRSEHGPPGTLGIRVSAELRDVVAAGAASAIAIGVETVDPEGLTGLPRDSEGAIGWTCVLLSPEATLSRLDGATVAERLGTHPILGDVLATGRTLGVDSILGGRDGIGAAGPALERARAAQAVARTSVTAGAEQRRLLVETSRSVLGNVMATESIEAWNQADLGARAFLARAIADAASALEANGGAVPSESRSLIYAVAGLEHGEAEGGQAPALQTPPLWRAPSGFLTAEAAALASDHRAFDAAWTTGLRQLATQSSQIAWSAIKGIRLTRSGREAFAARPLPLELGTVQVLQAWSMVCAAERLSSAPPRATDAASQALTTCAWVDLSHAIHDRQSTEEPLRRFVVETQLAIAVRDLEARIRVLGAGWARAFAGLAVRSLQRSWGSGPDAALAESVAAWLISHPEVVKRLSRDVHLVGSEAALLSGARLAAASRVPIAAVRRAQAVHQLPPDGFDEVLDLAASRRIITVVDAVKIRSCMAAASELLSFSSGRSGAEHQRKTA